MAKQHRLDTDMMRIVAALFVVLLHCADVGSHAGIVYNGLSRFSVPVFILISGYFTLSRNINLDYVAKKTVKTLFLLLVWASLYYGYSLVVGRLDSPSLAGYVQYICAEPIHLWYLWAAITLYLFSPLLQIFHQNAPKPIYRYVLGLLFVVGSLVKLALNSNLFPLLSTVVNQMKLPTTLGFLFLFLMGGYLHRFTLGKKEAVGLCVLGVGGTFATIGLSLLFEGTAQAALFYSFFSPFAMIAGIGFFVFAQQFSPKIAGANIPWSKLSACSLGIYLLHPLLIMALQDMGWEPFSTLSPLFAIPLKTALVFSSSLLLVFGYQRLKFQFHP